MEKSYVCFLWQKLLLNCFPLYFALKRTLATRETNVGLYVTENGLRSF